MNTLGRFTTLFLVAALVPMAQAGSSSSPELSDAAGDAPGAVDVTAAWYHSLPATPTTGEAAVDCNLFPCRDGFSITLKLRDLTAAAPVAEKAGNTQYVYEISFTPDVWGSTVMVRCVIAVADIVVGAVGLGPSQWPAVGTSCQIPSSGNQGDPFDVATTRASYFRHQSEDTTLTSLFVDRNADTLTVTLIEDLADIGPGTTFSDIQVTTYLAGLSGPGVAYKTVADTTAKGTSFVL